MAANIKYLVEKQKKLATLKSPWENPYQILGKYIYTKKQQFQVTVEPGAFLNDGMINDSTAVRANGAMASAVMGSLWKSGGKTFKIGRHEAISDSKINNDYFKKANGQLADAMESPKAGFETSFHEEISEEGAFGTSAIALFRGDYENPLSFKSWSIQNISISEGPDGYVDTVYYDEMVTISNIVGRYGLDKLPGELLEKYENVSTREDKVKVTVAIEPRPIEDREGVGVLGMPISSNHFLPEQNHPLRESGYAEMPVRVGRWYKLANEVYGRSPGMDALPAIMQINALKESFLVGVEKKVDPPLWILDDGTLGAGTVDTSARGLSVFNAMGRAGSQTPLGTIFDVGELNSCAQVIEQTKEEILQHFLIDKLYDLNNKTRMTLGEAEMRYGIRSDALSSLYARYTAEILNPLITRSFNILFDMGLLGVREDDYAQQAVLIANGIEPIILPPDIVEAIELGRPMYKIEYISPAARVMREEEMRGIISTVNNALQLAPVVPEAMLKLNTDKVLQYSQELGGAPADILFAEDVVAAKREAIRKAQEQQAQMQQAEMGSKALKNAAQAQQAGAAV